MSRYLEPQARLLTAFARYNAKRLSFEMVTPYALVPQWFKGGKPVRGFTSIKAPMMKAETRERCLALYDYAQQGTELHQNYAGLMASLLLWEALFPQSFRSTGFTLEDELAGWDPKADPMSKEKFEVWYALDHNVRLLTFNIRMYDEYRIATEQHTAAEFLGGEA